jgi:large subunit ribosomal protein L3
MKFLIATKEHMTQLFDEDGRVHPATILRVGPVVVAQVKSEERDGDRAVQIGYGERREKNINKSQRGHAAAARATLQKDKIGFAGFKELRLGSGEEPVSVGDRIDVSVFESGEEVTISSTSKGKGFQGVVKRHGFSGGPRTHGQKHSEREPGSIGATGPQRVFKGTRMAGRMGSDRVTVKRVKILRVDTEGNRIFVRGSVPGRRGTRVEIRGN